MITVFWASMAILGLMLFLLSHTRYENDADFFDNGG